VLPEREEIIRPGRLSPHRMVDFVARLLRPCGLRVVTRRGLLAANLLLLLTATAAAQNASTQPCAQIEASVVNKLGPTKIYRSEVSDGECTFEFVVAGGAHASLSIEINEGEEDARKSLHDYLHVIALHRGLKSEHELPLEKLDTNSSWDEVYFYKAEHFILLRKGKLAITLFSSKDEILIQMEKLLRDKVACKATDAASKVN
jgi:hypothetical protein